MARFVVIWGDVSLDQYLALSPDQQASIDARMAQLADDPDGAGCRYDVESDTWTATYAQAEGFIVYTFRGQGTRDARLFVLRLVFL